MAKYQSLDNRTGYPEGEIVELTFEELCKLPFNVKMKKLEVIEEKEVIEKSKEDKEKKELESLLLEKGLSKKRTEAVVAKYPNKKELKKNLKKAKIDKLTDAFLGDLDGDGDFDKDDLTIAAKTLARGRKKGDK